MRLEGFDFASLAERYGTPFYLYEMDAALEQLDALRRYLPDSTDVMYCMKANANQGVLRAFHEHTPYLDISSVGEMEMAMLAGYEPAAMSFAGPAKDEETLRCAVGAGVHTISLESTAELSRLVAVSRQLAVRQGVTIRINPAETAKAFMMRMGGRPSQFGVAEEEAGALVGQALAAPELHLRGIHVFAGTQCLVADAVVENIGQTLVIAQRLAEEHRIELELVNLGGGLGVPYFAGERALDPLALSQAIGDRLRRFVEEQPRFRKTRFTLELGRYLIGAFGIYVARVIEVKTTRGKRFAIMNGGMHHCFPPTGNFGQVIKKNYPVVNLSASPGRKTARYELVGPLCTPLDSMARDIELPEVEPGDLLCFANSGAYSFSASPLLFLGHDTPPELVYQRGELTLSRPRRSCKSFI